jgi:hypothetical protein
LEGAVDNSGETLVTIGVDQGELSAVGHVASFIQVD